MHGYAFIVFISTHSNRNGLKNENGMRQGRSPRAPKNNGGPHRSAIGFSIFIYFSAGTSRAIVGGNETAPQWAFVVKLWPKTKKIVINNTVAVMRVSMVNTL